ncbi:MAG: hypothetical protein JW895_15115 [Thermoleophilaceae bacterium]|nr:hypothetical protein [Thermoleophilaceae bacterium]
MAWHFRILVVANVTADTPELIAALADRASGSYCSFTLLVPAPAGGRAGREAAERRLASALGAMRAAGLEVDGRVGDQDAIAAVHDAWDPTRYDEVVVSTLPTGTSRWLQVDLPHRIERLTNVRVTHVVSHPKPPVPHTEPAPHPAGHGVLAPFAAIATSRRSSGGGGLGRQA